MKTVVMYHSHCFDGSMAAAAAVEAIRDGRLDCDEETGLIPIAYKDATRETFFLEDGKSPFSKAQFYGAQRYIFVDFCPKAQVVEDLIDMGYEVVILDHHKTAQEDVRFLEKLTGLDLNFDMSKSGARMAWEYFRKGSWDEGTVPRLVLHVEDRDLWNWEIEGTREAIAWLSAEAVTNSPQSYLDAVHAFAVGPEVCIKAGAYICKEMDAQIKKIAAGFRYLSFEGFGRGIVVNASCYQSEVCQYLYDRHDVPFVIAYHLNQRNEVALSFRSKEGAAHSIDVSSLARNFGGGGHKHASGGVSPLDCWIDNLVASEPQK